MKQKTPQQILKEKAGCLSCKLGLLGERQIIDAMIEYGNQEYNKGYNKAKKEDTDYIDSLITPEDDQ